MGLLHILLWNKKIEDKIYNAVGEDLKGMKYPTNDYFLDEAPNGDIRVYAALIRLPETEFINRYTGLRKVTLGHICQVEVGTFAKELKEES